MLSPERLALELLEYKLHELRSGKRTVTGDASVSAWRLREYLDGREGALDDAGKARFRQVSRELGDYAEVRVGGSSSVATFDDLVLDDLRPPYERPDGRAVPAAENALTDEEREELEILKRLANRAWWYDLERNVHRLAATYRVERERQTGRLLYALMRNFTLYAKHPLFPDDHHCDKFQVIEGVPELADPLISLSSLDALTQVIQEIIETALRLHAPQSPFAHLKIHPSQTLSYLKRLALAVARDPYAGRMTAAPSRIASSRQILLAIGELEREPMREEQRMAHRRQLEVRLQEARAYERSQRKVFDADVAMYRQAAESFFAQIAPLLPERIGGECGEPSLSGGVLFARNAALRLEEISERATSVTALVMGPLRFRLAGLDIGFTRNASLVSLFVNGTEYPLDVRLDLPLERWRVLAFREGAYVHVKLLDESRSLAPLLAEALFVREILEVPDPTQALRVLRAATGVSAAEPSEVVRAALERLAELVARTPEPKRAIRGFFVGAARASDVDGSTAGLDAMVERAHVALQAGRMGIEAVLDTAREARRALYQLGDDPISVTIEGMPITIRRYASHDRTMADHVVVMMPGRPLGSFTDTLIHRLDGGTLVCARSGSDLAVLYYPRVRATLPGHEPLAR